MLFTDQAKKVKPVIDPDLHFQIIDTEHRRLSKPQSAWPPDQET